MNVSKRALIVALIFSAILIATNIADFGVTSFAKEFDKKHEGKSSAKGKAHNFPDTAFEYAQLVEPILGVPPRVNLSEGVELPIYVDGVQKTGELGDDCDNPTRLGKGCTSGSVLQRYEGRTADGTPLPNVVWVSFGRNSSYTHNGTVRVLGSVQVIGHDMETGATAFFESSDAIDPWVDVDENFRMQGAMPWIDDPEEFNRAYKVPGMVQCVECHQNDPFIHSDFINAAKMPGTDEPVVPNIVERTRDMEFDLPYYAIGGENWDMRTLHIEGNKCLGCHRIGMATAQLFMSNGWHPNDHMPPKNPGSLAGDFQELLDCWEASPEETPGCEWVIPPAGDVLGRVVGDDYPYKSAFNIAAKKSYKDSGKSEGMDFFKDMSKDELLELMKEKGATEAEIAEFLEYLDKGDAKGE